MSLEPARLGISVAFSPGPGIVDEVALTVAAGATVADAVRASGLQARHPGFDFTLLPTGVWGAFRGADHPLRDGDRVELYRPLCVDPMEARRLRHKAGQRGSAPGSA